MLRPSNLFKNSSLQPSGLQNYNLQKQALKQTQPQNNQVQFQKTNDVVDIKESKPTVDPENIESKIEKISNEVSSFITSTTNAYSEQKKELVEMLNNFISSSKVNQPVEQTPHERIQEQKIINTKLNNDSNIDLLSSKKAKHPKKSYSKAVGDVLERIKLIYPGLKADAFDKIYISGEDIYYKLSNRYALLDTQLYCKLSK